MESHVHRVEVDGYGEFSSHEEEHNVVLHFGPVEVRAESCDIALMRLANALMDHPKLSRPFFAHMRDPSKNPPVIHLRNNYLTLRPTIGKS